MFPFPRPPPRARSGAVVWLEDLTTSQQTPLVRHVEEVATLAISPDGHILASASGPTAVGAGRILFHIHPSRNNAGQVTGNLGQVCLWDVTRGECLRDLLYHLGAATALAFCHGGHRLVSVGNFADNALVRPSLDVE